MGILIVGSGNGGLALGSVLLEKGEIVNLYDKYEEVINPIRNNGNKITVINEGVKKDIKFNLVTNNLKEALYGIEYIIVTVPAFAHESVAIEVSEHIKDNQIIILHPGRTGGALEFKKIFTLNKKNNIIAETDTLLFACRKDDPIGTKINIYGIKKNVGIAAIPSDKSQDISDNLNTLLPYFHNRKNVLSTSLGNIGAIFHPVTFLFNLTRTERKERYKFYHEGVTPYIANIMESIDNERLEIAKAFGLSLPNANKWLNFNYNIEGKSLYESIQLNIRYEEIYAPTNVNSRYVMEDVPMSLVPMAELAKLVNVNTPTTNALINLASEVYNYDFIKNGRTISKMGIQSNNDLKDTVLNFN